uniref:Uncharacterized protein n=1 Tax=Oryza sativa subsp. japonica TaxID=39947 RepID=Q7EZV1_ORYSJ|nr:hypothetical protein [Oryza sativa Japonica Group]
MGSRDGFSNNKLLDDFGYHPSLKICGVPKDVRSYDVERVRNKWSSYDYYLVLNQRCSDFSYYLYFNKVDSRKILFDIDEDSMSLWFYTKID